MHLHLELVAPEIVIAALAIATLSLDLIIPKNQRAFIPYLSILGLGGALVISIMQIGNWGMALNKAFASDPLTAFVRIASIGLILLVILASLRSSTSVGREGEYYGLLLFSLLGALVMAASADLITLYLGLELSALPAYVLVAFQKHRLKSGEAALKYFLIGLFASLMLVYGMSLVFGFTGEIEFKAIAKHLKEGQDALILAIFLLLGGFGFKITAFPFHFWAPDAYDGASAPIAAYLAAILKLAAFAAVLRVFLWALPAVQADWKIWFAVLAYVTMTAGNLMALPQKNIKRLLAYSSISQAGYALIGLGTTTQLAFGYMFFFIFTYMIGTVGAFLVVAACSTRREADEIDDYKGLAQRNPLLALSMLIFLLSLIGIPPLAGFMGKLFLFGAAIEGGKLGLALAGGINTVISMGYYVRIMKVIYLDKPKEPTFPRIPASLRWGVYLAAFATIAVGIFYGPFLDLSRQAGRLF